MNASLLRIILLTGLLLIALPGLADQGFVADAIEESASGQRREARLYALGARTRLEFDNGDRRVVRIDNPIAGERLILFPDDKRYLRAALPSSSAESDICAQLPSSLRCNRSDNTIHQGRAAVTWLIKGHFRGQPYQEERIVDIESGRLLKQVVNGLLWVEQKRGEEENIDGRLTERWERRQRTMAQQGGRAGSVLESVTSWYDPTLPFALPLREERADGSSRSLLNLRTEHVPKSLFAIPAGYREQQISQRHR